jgi:hypothetical protein
VPQAVEKLEKIYEYIRFIKIINRSRINIYTLGRNEYEVYNLDPNIPNNGIQFDLRTSKIYDVSD